VVGTTSADIGMSGRLMARILFFMGVGCSEAVAQWPSDVEPGARVRVRLPEVQYQESTRRGHLVRGRVSALGPDTLYLAVTDSVGPLAVPRSLIQRLDLSRGVPSRGANALRQGVITGALSALMLVLINEADGLHDTGDAALIGGGVGFATGAFFGALFPRERWKSVRFSSP
jgi:hypothetical protein